MCHGKDFPSNKIRFFTNYWTKLNDNKMLKRKSDIEDPGDKRGKKIAKLERKLAKYRREQSRQLDDEIQAQTQELDPEVIYDEAGPSGEQGLSGQQATSDLSEMLEVDSVAVQDKTDTTDELDSEVLTALGEASSGNKQYGEKIHVEIFNTIHTILLVGMTKQTKEKLLESLLIPSNCKLLDAPKINTELLAVLSNPSKTRDKLLQDRQQETGLAVGTVCQVINALSKKEYDKLNIIKKLSDVARVLSNIHYQYTEIRRKLVNPFLDKNLAESLKENRREEYLYSNLDDSVKSYSAMKRAANVIKPKATTRFTPKNFQQPPRRFNPNQGPPGRGSYRGTVNYRYNQRQPFKPQDNRPTGASMRGRAKYP